MPIAHTARFLQTFHTAKTQKQRTEDSGSATPTDKIDKDPAALAFVKGQKLTGGRVQANAPRPAAGEIVEVQGWKVLTGSGLTTEPQAKFMIGIATSREGVTEPMIESLKARLEQGMARSAASAFITKYKDLPRKVRVTASMAEATAPGAPTEAIKASTLVEEDGIYIDPIKGRIFKVQFNKAQGSGSRLYAKQLWIDIPAGYRSEGLLELDLSGIDRDEWSREWRYAPGLIRFIKPEWKLTEKQAEQYGTLYGSCIRCGRDLTKESSIRNAMGDKCAAASGF